MTTPHKYAEVIKAWADGKAIQCRCTGDIQGEWEDACEASSGHLPYFASQGVEWRIKPEVKTQWLAISKQGISEVANSKEGSKARLKARIAEWVEIEAVIQITYTEGEGLE